MTSQKSDDHDGSASSRRRQGVPEIPEQARDRLDTATVRRASAAFAASAAVVLFVVLVVVLLGRLAQVPVIFFGPGASQPPAAVPNPRPMPVSNALYVRFDPAARKAPTDVQNNLLLTRQMSQ